MPNGCGSRGRGIRGRGSRGRGSRGKVSRGRGGRCRASQAGTTVAVISQVDHSETHVGKNGFIWNKGVPLEKFEESKKFSLISALKTGVSDCKTLKDFFNYFINDHMIEIILYGTNKRMIGQVKPVNITEMRGFIGLLLLFGVTKKNDI